MEEVSSSGGDAKKGLYAKYYVARVDGRDKPGGDKEDAEYFVLDYVNDPLALPALAAYADAARRAGYGPLADDLERIVAEHSTPPPTERAACGRLLVGQGDDTADPRCALPAGHQEPCSPTWDGDPEEKGSPAQQQALGRLSRVFGDHQAATQHEAAARLEAERARTLGDTLAEDRREFLEGLKDSGLHPG